MPSNTRTTPGWHTKRLWHGSSGIATGRRSPPWRRGSGSRSEEEVDAAGAEQQVWPPGRQQRRQHFVAAHLLKEPDRPPVGQADGDADGDPVQGAALADREGKGQPDQDHNEAGEREGDLTLQGNLQVDDVEAGL